MSTGSVTSVFRNLFLLIDTGVYWLVDQAYWLFSMLSEASIFTQTQIESFASRIYVLVSIIMFFKLGFSFINYIINPDSFTDKQKGGAALIKKIVITMALLVSVPTIFNEAYYLQKIIFQNHVIDKVLLGDTSSQTDDANKNNAISTYAFLTFFKPTSYLEECRTYEGVSISAACEAALNKEDTTNHNPGTAYKAALANYDLKTIMQSEIANTTGIFTSNSGGDFYKADAFYLFDYNYPISTVVGGFLAWIMIGFCLDLAVRSVKLSFLQIIAPIPIILSLSPQQKNNTLANWGKECVSTWASLFIRVLVITFALSAIITINTDGGIFSFVTGGTNQFSMVTVFVMLGILLFAKEFPKLLEDILGIKGAGKMTFNPLKRMTEAPVVGKTIGKGLALTSAAAHLGVNTLKNKALSGLEKAFADRKDGAGNTLDPMERRMMREQRYAERQAANKKEFEGRRNADPTKAYSGDTQRKLMHKQNVDERMKLREQERQQKETEDMINIGHRANSEIEANAKGIIDSIVAGNEISDVDKKKVYDSYRRAYNGDAKYSENEANLAMAKGKQEYLKNTVGQLERMAAANPDDVEIAKKLSVAQKALDNAGKQVSGLEENAKNMELTNKTSAKISKGIKLSKGYDKKGDVALKNVNVDDMQQMFTNAQQASSGQQQQLQDSITAAIREGFANMQGNGAPQPSNNQQTRPSGIVDSSGRPISSGNSQASGQVNRPINTNNSQPSNHNNQNIIDDDHRGF